MSLAELEADAASHFLRAVEKEVGANPAIQNLMTEHGARIKEIKILKEKI